MTEKIGDHIVMSHQLRWPEPIYMRVGYVLKPRFSAGKIWPISMIFASSIKNETVIYFLVGLKPFEISAYV